MRAMQVEQRAWTPEDGWQPALTGPSLGARAQVVFLFGSLEHARKSECFARVREHYPQAHVIGCTTAGQIHDTRVSDETVSLTAVHFEHTGIGVARAEVDGMQDSFAAGARLAQALDPRGLRHVFVLSEGLRLNPSELVHGIDSALPESVTVSGGCAGDDSLTATYVWTDGAPCQRAVVALGLYGERLQLGISALGGWRPFGPDRVITRSDKNVLYEFDGRPALALYKEYLGKYAAELPTSGLMFPLELRAGGENQCVLRALLSVNEAEQSITYAGNVPQGSLARFMFATIDELIQSTHSATAASIRGLAFPPQLSLVVSCSGRRYVMKQRIEEEIEAVREVLGPGTAITGFYSYGEIAPAEGGGRSLLHNETLTITSLAES
jgi:hypothetical protein